jgi:general stress protein 26
LPWTWAVDRLTRTQNYFLTTVRKDGRPHVMPLWGVWLNNRFYFSTGKNSVKARNLALNPNCILAPGRADEAVILEGAAEQVAGGDELQEFAKAYKTKYDFDPLSMNEPVFRIRPRVVFGQIEKTFTQTATRWKF